MQQVISGAMLALKLVSAYFLIVALFALKKPKPIPRANPKTRFACVIAARNEGPYGACRHPRGSCHLKAARRGPLQGRRAARSV